MIEFLCLSFLTLFSIVGIINNTYYIYLLNNEHELENIDPKTLNYYMKYSFILAKGEQNKFLGLAPIEWKSHIFLMIALYVGFFFNIFVAIIVSLYSFVTLCVKRKINQVTYNN